MAQNKNFTISIDEKLLQRIYFLRKICKSKNKNLYQEIEKLLEKYISEKEKKIGISKSDYAKKALCPKCGSLLRIVKNKQGQKFIGCSSFPKCNYSASLAEKEE